MMFLEDLSTFWNWATSELIVISSKVLAFPRGLYIRVNASDYRHSPGLTGYPKYLSARHGWALLYARYLREKGVFWERFTVPLRRSSSPSVSLFPRLTPSIHRRIARQPRLADFNMRHRIRQWADVLHVRAAGNASVQLCSSNRPGLILSGLSQQLQILFLQIHLLPEPT